MKIPEFLTRQNQNIPTVRIYFVGRQVVVFEFLGVILNCFFIRRFVNVQNQKVVSCLVLVHKGNNLFIFFVSGKILRKIQFLIQRRINLRHKILFDIAVNHHVCDVVEQIFVLIRQKISERSFSAASDAHKVINAVIDNFIANLPHFLVALDKFAFFNLKRHREMRKCFDFAVGRVGEI